MNAPRRGTVLVSRVSGNRGGVPPVFIGMAPRSTPSRCVNGPLYRRRALMAGCMMACLAVARALPAEDRITQPIDDSQRTVLPGHVSPRIESAVDQGPV